MSGGMRWRDNLPACLCGAPSSQHGAKLFEPVGLCTPCQAMVLSANKARALDPGIVGVVLWCIVSARREAASNAGDWVTREVRHFTPTPTGGTWSPPTHTLAYRADVDGAEQCVVTVLRGDAGEDEDYATRQALPDSLRVVGSPSREGSRITFTLSAPISVGEVVHA